MFQVGIWYKWTVLVYLHKNQLNMNNTILTLMCWYMCLVHRLRTMYLLHFQENNQESNWCNFLLYQCLKTCQVDTVYMWWLHFGNMFLLCMNHMQLLLLLMKRCLVRMECSQHNLI